MNKISSPTHCGNPLWEFLFQLTCLSPSSNSWLGFCFLAGKMLALSQPLMLISYGTTYSSYSDLASYLTVMTYFSTYPPFYTFCYILFALVQLFSGFTVQQLLRLRRKMRKSQPLESAGYQFVHGFLAVSAKVLPHIVIPASGFAVASVLGEDYAGFKHLMKSPDQPEVQLYVCVALMTIASVEVVAAAVCFLVFCQDRSIIGRSFWSADTWYHSAAELGFAMLIHTEFFIDISIQMSYALRLAARCICVLISLFYTRYAHFWMDLAELLFASFETTLAAFILLFDTMGWSFGSYASYPILLLCLSLLFCLIRALTVWLAHFASPPKNEASTVRAIQDLFVLARGRDQKSLATLLGLLTTHSWTCQTAGCPCRELIKGMVEPGEKDRRWLLGREAARLQESQEVHFTEQQVSDPRGQSAVTRTVRLLVDELSSQTKREIRQEKEDELGVLLAEAAFHFFGNFYVALQRIAQIEAGKPRLIMRQRTYNLRRVISLGISKSAGPDELAKEGVIAALEYLKHYHRFLDEVEDATEATVKFWSIVMEEAPSSGSLNEQGKRLFELKYSSIKTIEKISDVAYHNLEFLVRYGLFMRQENMVTSERVFHKIVALNANMASNSQHSEGNSGFSVFRSDVEVMLIIAKLEHTGAGTITEMNSAVEHVLGFGRADLVGSSVNKIMPQPIAQIHESLVHTFFQTMKAYSIGTPKPRFVKTKEGQYVLCRSVKRIVPRLSEDLQVAMFMIQDQRLGFYTAFKREPTEKAVGAVLCVSGTFTLLGLTGAALETFGISEDRVKEFVGTATLLDFFPWLAKKELQDKLLEKEGRVVAYQSPDVVDSTLLWARLVLDQSPAKSGEVLVVALIFSEIQKTKQQNYRVSEEGAFYRDPDAKFAVGTWSVAEAVKVTTRTEEKKQTAQEVLAMSDVASVASVSCAGSTSSQGHTLDLYETAHELQAAAITRQVSSTIKCFGAGVFGVLVVIWTLIWMNAYLVTNEVSTLRTRFELTEVYHLRYKEMMMVADIARAYSTYIQKGTVDRMRGYLNIRLSTLAKYNVDTRRLLFTQGLGYDSEIVTIKDLSKAEYNCTLSYALLVVFFVRDHNMS